MKKIITAVCVLLLAVPMSAQSKKKTAPEPTPDLRKIEAQIAELDGRIAAAELEANRLVWEKFIERSVKSARVIDIWKLDSFSPAALYDTVPHLGELERVHKAIDDEYVAMLATDPEYEGIRERWVASKDDTRARAEVNKEYNVLYDRLKRANPEEYTPLNNRRREAKIARDAAVTRWLLDYYQSRGEVMPTDNVITHSELRTIRAFGDISALTEDVNVLKQTRSKLKQKRADLIYGTDSSAADKIVVGGGC